MDAVRLKKKIADLIRNGEEVPEALQRRLAELGGEAPEPESEPEVEPTADE